MTATAIDATQTRVPGKGRVLVAPKGSTVPPDTSTAWDAAWQDLGFTDEKGVTLSKKDTKTSVNAWQALTPIRHIITGRDLHAMMVLQQWNKVTLALWSGEGPSAVVANGAVSGEYKLSFSPSPIVDERMLGIEWTDTDFVVTHRMYFSRGLVTDTADIPITRTGLATLGVTYESMAIDQTTAIAVLLMKDPAMAP